MRGLCESILIENTFTLVLVENASTFFVVVVILVVSKFSAIRESDLRTSAYICIYLHISALLVALSFGELWAVKGKQQSSNIKNNKIFGCFVTVCSFIGLALRVYVVSHCRCCHNRHFFKTFTGEIINSFCFFPLRARGRGCGHMYDAGKILSSLISRSPRQEYALYIYNMYVALTEKDSWQV